MDQERKDSMTDQQRQQQLAEAELEQRKAQAATDLLERITDETTRRDLMEQELRRRQFNQDWRLAQVFAAAGYFKDAVNEYQAMAKMEIGRSWGLNPAESIRYVYFTPNGKPAVEGEIVAARLQAAGWDWDSVFINGEADCKGVRLYLKKNGQPFMVPKRLADGTPQVDKDGNAIMQQACVSFTEEQAMAIKVYEKGNIIPMLEKANWRDGWRANLYFWKAIMQMKRFYAPGVLLGVDDPEESVQSTGAPDQFPAESREDVIQRRLAALRPAAEDARREREAREEAEASNGTPAPQPEPRSEQAPEAAKEKLEPVLIDNDQATRLSALAVERGMSPRDLAEMLSGYGFKNVAAITVNNYDSLVNLVSKWTHPAEPPSASAPPRGGLFATGKKK